MRPIHIAPSILAANFASLETDIKRMIQHHVEYLHYDIMDGHFVPNLSFGVPVVASITKAFKVIHDVHLMIEKPRDYFDAFIQAGANIITFHYEVGTDVRTMLSWIDYLHQHKVKAGISIKPKTPVDVLLPLIKNVDLCLVMSVEPGFGGQTFLSSALDKITWLRKQIDNTNSKALIEVDGGINAETGKQCRLAGADILVAGSYLFNHPQLKEAIQSLRDE
jgi:ribulose-phosphate 3-epimerase